MRKNTLTLSLLLLAGVLVTVGCTGGGPTAPPDILSDPPADNPVPANTISVGDPDPSEESEVSGGTSVSISVEWGENTTGHQLLVTVNAMFDSSGNEIPFGDVQTVVVSSESNGGIGDLRVTLPGTQAERPSVKNIHVILQDRVTRDTVDGPKNVFLNYNM